MSTYQHLAKTALFAFALVIASFSFTACGGDDSVTTHELASMTPVVAPSTQEQDKKFLIRAVEMRYEQILLNKLAQQRSSNEEIKAVAAALEQANRDGKSALASLGYSHSIKVPAVPTASAQAAYDTLNTAEVEFFYTEFINAVVKGYNDAIAHYEGAGRAQLNPDIQAKVTAMIPDLRSQLAKVNQVVMTENATASAD
jgi:putative membrane protein